MSKDQIHLLIICGIVTWFGLLLVLYFIDLRLADVNAHLTAIQALLAAGWQEDPRKSEGGDWNRPSRGGRRVDQPMCAKRTFYKIFGILALMGTAWGQTPAPSYFAMGLVNYNRAAVPGVAVGARVTGQTYVVATLQQPVHGQAGKVDLEVWQRLATRGRASLWAGTGLGLATATTTAASTNSGVTFQAAASFELVKRWGLFCAFGTRESMPVNSSRPSNDKFGGIGLEF